MQEKILSVGIDIGTSTSQMVISKLTLENLASDFTVPRIEISDKEIVYRSEIIFTPLNPSNRQEIAIEPLKKFIETEYKKAGIKADEIQTGGVIITGETARKANAENVLKSLSHLAGDFVVATAGPDLESIIAGKGAGTQKLSKEKGGRAVNLDIGGGTSNLACFNNNEIESTGCFDIGGRLIKLDKNSQIVSYISEKIEKIISDKQLKLKVGAKAEIAEIRQITDEFARILAHAVGVGAKPEYFDLFITNHSIKLLADIPYVTFSGGVADCLNEEITTDFFKYGDIGLILGQSIRKSEIFSEKTVAQSLETIQATVVGAGSHLTEVSGSTISYTEKNLPLQNIPVVHLENVQGSIRTATLAEQIREKLKWFSDSDYDGPIAIAYEGWKNPLFKEVQSLAEEIQRGLQTKIDSGQTLIVISWHDMGKAVGQALYQLLPRGHPYVSIDSIQVDSGDYIDIGIPVASGSVLPVVVKTLVFE
ncbi:MAG: ethanolamine ammonia-lyase reactivating factor EutA [Streptococcaceae bacterium]|jgi:ethanolamine utilization protein EutA|nr:ethanolamine ammonia-lyase reactivating factor EutA [Streptococcaceae bacterium]